MRPYSVTGVPEEKTIFDFRLSILAARCRVATTDTTFYSDIKTTQPTIQATKLPPSNKFCTYSSAGFVDSYDESGAFKTGEWQSII